MERIEGNRIRIIGRKLSEGAPVRRSAFDGLIDNLHLKNYFKAVELEYSQNRTFQRQVFYIAGITNECPRPRRNRIEQNISGLHGYRRRCPWDAVVYHPRAEGATEPTIAFVFDGGKAVRAVYYKESGTLLLGNFSLSSASSVEYLEKIMSFLTTPDESGKVHLAPLPAIDAPAAEVKSYIHMVELHKGEQVIVKLDADRKLCTTGCDPEFEYLGNGIAKRPSRVFKGTTPNTEIGVDGSGLSVELRPKPFEKPSDMISYMIGIMERLPGEIGLSVAGNHFPLGGHVHIGVNNQEYHPSSDLIWLLDSFLGRPTVDLSGSMRGSYKHVGQVREQPWGYEYRTPPSAIFAFPEIARIAVKMCKVLTECYINGQTMEINQPLQFEDYWNYAGLIPKEYELWQGFLAQYRSSDAARSANVVPLWTCEDAKKRYPSQLEAARVSPGARAFRKNLEETQAAQENEAAVRIRQELDRARRNAASPQRRPAVEVRPITFRDDWSASVVETFEELIVSASASAPVSLFGLGAGRGDVVFGFDCDGFERIPANSDMNWAGYGIPYRVRYPRNEQDIADGNRIARAVSQQHSITTGTASTAGRPSFVEAAPVAPAQTFDEAFDEAAGVAAPLTQILDALRPLRTDAPSMPAPIVGGRINEDWTDTNSNDEV